MPSKSCEERRARVIFPVAIYSPPYPYIIHARSSIRVQGLCKLDAGLHLFISCSLSRLVEFSAPVELRFETRVFPKEGERERETIQSDPRIFLSFRRQLCLDLSTKDDRRTIAREMVKEFRVEFLAEFKHPEALPRVALR